MLHNASAARRIQDSNSRSFAKILYNDESAYAAIGELL